MRRRIASDESGAPPSAASQRNLPRLLLEYVQRTHEHVLLDDAAADPGRFSRDDYLARARPRSVLGLPIRRQAEVVGVLYLENDLLPGAFTPERLVALDLLATQAAISLENALLLQHERAGRVEAEAAERRARLLAEATAIMSSTLDYDSVFGTLTNVCVRWFADWAVIDVVEGEKSSRLAGAHRDPEKESLLRELSERYPASPGSPAPAARVLSDGKPLLVSNMDEAMSRDYTTDDWHLELIRQLGTASVMVVPLVARDTMLGALSLASGSPGRYGPPDLELATEIGRRAALAMDNARLLRETQQAVQLRDDFLSVASHELRTPVTSLMITVAHLLRAGESRRPLSTESLYGGLNRVKHSAERLRRLTDELLDVTRIQQGQLELAPVTVDLRALVREVVEGLEPELAAAHCAVRVEAPEEVMGVWDPSRLEQVITNLLTNSIKFGPGRPIEVSVCDSAENVQFSVRDHGVGIDPARKPFLFNRFERAVSSAHYGGLGLGLYISRRIVQAHGGNLRVDSEPGQGATFTATLPRMVPTGGPATGQP